MTGSTKLHALSKYKCTKYFLQNLNKENRIAKLAKMESKDPKMFWRTVKHLINKRAVVANILPQNWVNYFRELLNIKPQNIKKFSDYIKVHLPVIKNTTERGPLDWSYKTV